MQSSHIHQFWVAGQPQNMNGRAQVPGRYKKGKQLDGHWAPHHHLYEDLEQKHCSTAADTDRGERKAEALVTGKTKTKQSTGKMCLLGYSDP